MASMEFPIGYHSLHLDTSMNFQMNRWFGWVGEPDMLEAMRMAAPRIATFVDWKREFLALAERASQQGRVLRAGFYWRSAEFFMRADDPERKGARARFLGAVRSVYGLELGERHAVPYADGRIRGFLPAYRLKPPRAKCTFVFCGGFDSCIEELTSAFIYLRDAGYDVIAFDGPGQGGALDEAGLLMMFAECSLVMFVMQAIVFSPWVKPDATRWLIGMTCGGCIGNATHALKPINGVRHVDVSLAAGEATDTSYPENGPSKKTR